MLVCLNAYIVILNCLTLISVCDKFQNNKLHFTYLLPFSMAYLYMDSIWSQTRLKSKWQSRLCHWSQWPITSSFRNCELITKNLAWVSDSIWSIWSENCSYLWSNRNTKIIFYYFRAMSSGLCCVEHQKFESCPALYFRSVPFTLQFVLLLYLKGLWTSTQSV